MTEYFALTLWLTMHIFIEIVVLKAIIRNFLYLQYLDAVRIALKKLCAHTMNLDNFFCQIGLIKVVRSTSYPRVYPERSRRAYPQQRLWLCGAGAESNCVTLPRYRGTLKPVFV